MEARCQTARGEMGENADDVRAQQETVTKPKRRFCCVVRKKARPPEKQCVQQSKIKGGVNQKTNLSQKKADPAG